MTKLMSLRYDGTCSQCDGALAAKTKAWWDSVAKSVTCVPCRTVDEPASAPVRPPDGTVRESRASPAPALPPPPAIDHGVGGIAAAKEYERRKAKHERKVEEKWGTGRIGRFAKFMFDEPQSTAAWAKGAEGERQLARRLNEDLAGVAIVLHDRKVPRTRGNIDHLVVAPSGVWIVDAKNYAGKVEMRDVGGWFSTDVRLLVNGRNQTKLVDGLGWQADAVNAVLESIGFGEAPLHRALCFTSSEWGWFAKPLRMNGVVITWRAALIEAIRQPGPLNAAMIDLVARELSSKLPASR